MPPQKPPSAKSSPKMSRMKAQAVRMSSNSRRQRSNSGGQQIQEAKDVLGSLPQLQNPSAASKANLQHAIYMLSKFENGLAHSEDSMVSNIGSAFEFDSSYFATNTKTPPSTEPPN